MVKVTDPIISTILFFSCNSIYYPTFEIAMRLLLQPVHVFKLQILLFTLRSITSALYLRVGYDGTSTLFDDLTRDSIANNFVIDVYCRCLQILYEIAINCKRYSLQFGVKSVGIYSRHL